MVKITTWLAIFTNKPFLNVLIKFLSICKKTIIFLGTALVMQWEEIAIPSTRSQTMSVFSRLTDVINANLHSLLDKSEEPEKMLRLMI
ncbi:MAG: phage shock protein PspA, partial [Aeromonas veronii]